LLGAFRKTIETEIERKLDELLAAEGRPQAQSKAVKPAKPAAKKR
jgi:hypothetical protein